MKQIDQKSFANNFFVVEFVNRAVCPADDLKNNLEQEF